MLKLARSHITFLVLVIALASVLTGCIFEGNPGGPFM